MLLLQGSTIVLLAGLVRIRDRTTLGADSGERDGPGGGGEFPPSPPVRARSVARFSYLNHGSHRCACVRP